MGRIITTIAVLGTLGTIVIAAVLVAASGTGAPSASPMRVAGCINGECS